MGVPWRERSAPPGFGYAGGFQDILTAYNGLNHRGANIRYHDNQALLQKQKEHLENLKKDLEKEEREFFEMFEISYDEKNKKASFKELQDKLDAWNGTNAGKLINNSQNTKEKDQFYDGLVVLKKYAVFAEIPDQDWNEVLRQALSMLSDDDKENIKSNKGNIATLVNSLIDEMSDKVETSDKKGKKKSTIKKFATKGSSTLIDNIKVSLDDKGELQIVSDRNKISPEMQLKLITTLRKLMDKKEKSFQPNYDFEKMFEEFFETLKIKDEGKIYIKMALRDFKDVLKYYAFNSSDSQLKGFLGEIYNNAFLYYMASGNKAKKDTLERITPTGTELNEKGKQVVIDTWLRGVGIQVKNYEINKVMNTGFEFSESYTAGKFVQNALQLKSVGASNTASVADILLNFFTAYDYNQDYTKEDQSYAGSDAYKFWRQARDRMESKIKDDKAFTNIITPYVDKLIGIDRRFSSENIFIPPDEEATFNNTFFNISGKYIPSSLVVQAIIDTIDKKKTAIMDMISITAGVTSYQKSTLDKWNPNVTNTKVEEIFNKRSSSEQGTYYADTSHVKYSIKLDIKSLSSYILEKL